MYGECLGPTLKWTSGTFIALFWSGWFSLDMGPVSILFDLESRDALVESSQQVAEGDEQKPPASLLLSNEKKRKENEKRKTHEVQRKKCILYSILTAITYHFISYLLFRMTVYLFYVLQLYDVCYFIFNLSVQIEEFLGAWQILGSTTLNSHYNFLWCFQMARIMIVLEVEMTFIIDLFIGQVALVLQGHMPSLLPRVALGCFIFWSPLDG